MLRLCSAVLVLLVVAGSAQQLPWWKTANLYQVYPRSFKDSDGDGVGDLKGIAQEAEYFRDIGVDAIWISPIFQSPMVDFGYDISNFTDIDPLFGTMDDFDHLVARMKEVGVKLLLDFVPNHSSDEHLWFKISSNPSDPLYEYYKDFYVWRDPKGWVNSTTPIPPNNWFSIFAGGAWQWWPARQQYYFHQFKIQQPDFNFRNPRVIGNLTEVLNFWLDKGIDGFRMDAVPFIYEDANFPDDPVVPGTSGARYEDLQHIYDNNQPETYALMAYWAEVVKQRGMKDGRERLMMEEVYQPIDITMKYFVSANYTNLIPFNFFLQMFMNQSSRSNFYKQQIDNWMAAMPSWGTASWVSGNHDFPRASDKVGTEMVDSINLMMGVLPGIKVTYYGEEIGMEDTFVREDETMDHTKFSTDRIRTPMQWDSSISAGFSTKVKPWLPVNPNYWRLNVATQKAAESSHLKVYQAMTQARKDPVLQRGDLRVLAPDNDTLVIVRSYNNLNFVFLANIGSTVLNLTSQNLFGKMRLDGNLTVVVGSINSGYTTGTKMKQGSINISLRPKSSVLLRTSTSSSVAVFSYFASLLLALSMILTRL